MKDEVRRILIEQRNNLTKKEILEKSNIIKNKLFELKEFKNAGTILFYVSYDNEVFTHEMIIQSISNKKNVIVPISDKKKKKLILSKLKNWDDLSIGSYGILEPKKEKIKKVSINKIDLIIVPGVGFDIKGNRIGHGKGYYDILLLNSKVLRIGLAFELQIVKKIPVESYDIAVNKIVTEKKVINCSN
jgi:5-formyltetrahydrofolate cyclo-ligase